MKKHMVFLWLLIAYFFICGLTVSAQEDTDNNWIYNLNYDYDSGKTIIENLDWKNADIISANVYVPKSIDGYEVKSLSNLFYKKISDKVQSIKIDADISILPVDAFKDRKNLMSVKLPDTITVIESGTFDNCQSLVTIDMPNRLSSLGMYAFRNCIKLRNIKIPVGVQSILGYTFENCKSLTAVDLSSVTNIEDAAFAGCESLTEITFPVTVRTIKDYAFADCIKLKKVTTNEDIIVGKSFLRCAPDLVIYGKTGGNMEMYCKANSIKFISNGLKKFKVQFFNEYDLVGTQFVEYGKNATPPVIKKNGYISVWGNEVNDIENDCSIYVKWVNTFIYGNYRYKINQGKGNEVTLVGAVNTKISKVIIPDQVQYNNTNFLVIRIKNKVFKNNEYIKTLKIGNNVKQIDWEAFYMCKKLSSIKFGNNIESISKSAFEGCINIKSLKFPKSLKSVGDNAFAGNKRLKAVYLNDNLFAVGNYTFRDCTALEKVTTGKKLKAIYPGAFLNCKKLKSITIPSYVYIISDKAFKNCKSLKKILIKTKRLDKVGVDALKNINTQALITVPKNKLKAYKELFKYKGQRASVRIRH
ncbi:leucine-rich repeat domain-containing protein [Robinsoniella sp. KNHs210]|uniref:leucine-rich repeat domain-containing protein n=1 Tax=Robinsoniella sp. KNHs210 TaxID=1469950 RepID=UPI0004884C2F|nr:leucine-rich repeat domain-containing protein [Robinsoniella sp. KNHs210]